MVFIGPLRVMSETLRRRGASRVRVGASSKQLEILYRIARRTQDAGEGQALVLILSSTPSRVDVCLILASPIHRAATCVAGVGGIERENAWLERKKGQDIVAK